MFPEQVSSLRGRFSEEKHAWISVNHRSEASPPSTSWLLSSQSSHLFTRDWWTFKTRKKVELITLCANEKALQLSIRNVFLSELCYYISKRGVRKFPPVSCMKNENFSFLIIFSMMRECLEIVIVVSRAEELKREEISKTCAFQSSQGCRKALKNNFSLHICPYLEADLILFWKHAFDDEMMTKDQQLKI